MVKIFSPKDTTWINADNDSVPIKFVPATDKLKEALAGKLYKQALKVEAELAAFHASMEDAFTQVLKLIKEAYDLKGKKLTTKGSITWYNFDRSIKLEADMNEIPKWDDALMSEAKILMDGFLSSNMSEANELISKLVSSAFSNSKGMIDTAKVFQILKYQDKIKNQAFQKACNMMKNAQSIDRTKRYMRIWVKDDNGQYRNVNLNFSSL